MILQPAVDSDKMAAGAAWHRKSRFTRCRPSAFRWREVLARHMPSVREADKRNIETPMLHLSLDRNKWSPCNAQLIERAKWHHAGPARLSHEMQLRQALDQRT